MIDWLVGRAETHYLLEWEVKGSNLGPDKSDTELSMVRHCCIIFKKLCCPGVPTMGLCKLLNAKLSQMTANIWALRLVSSRLVGGQLSWTMLLLRQN